MSEEESERRKAHRLTARELTRKRLLTEGRRARKEREGEKGVVSLTALTSRQLHRKRAHQKQFEGDLFEDESDRCQLRL